MIKDTFSAKSQANQKISEDKTMTLLKTPGFLERLYSLLTDPSELYKKRTTILIKTNSIKQQLYLSKNIRTNRPILKKTNQYLFKCF